MKVEMAYSLEVNYSLTAEEAYDLYWIGIITDKKAFTCSDKNCDAQITCANLNKYRNQMSKSPYYKVYGRHSKKCKCEENIKNESHQLNNKRNHRNIGKIESNIDIFMEKRPKSHYMKKKKTKNNNESTEATIKTRKNKNTICSKSRSTTHYNIRPIVKRFNKYKKTNDTSNNYINIKSYKISYFDMFNHINSIDMTNVYKYNRVYYGTIDLIKHKEAYILKFKDEIIVGNKTFRPSIYISYSLIDKQLHPGHWYDEFQRLAHVKNNIVAYYYGKPKLNFINDNRVCK